MQLPLEIAMEVGSFLDARDLRVSTTQLCSEGVKFVARPITDRNATMHIVLDGLISSSSASSYPPAAQRASAQDVAQEALKRIEFFLARRANVAKITLYLDGIFILNKRGSVYAELYRHFQHAAQVQPNQNQAITVEWHVSRALVTQVAGLVELGSATAPSNEAAVYPRYRLLLMLNTLYDSHTGVSELALCQSLHTLDLSGSRVPDVSALASSQSLHTLNLSGSRVTDVSVLAQCHSLHTLRLSDTQVSDVSALATCPSLHKLTLSGTKVRDVSALASCQSLHTLILFHTAVADVSALASSESLHRMCLDDTKVTDAAALARCRTLHRLDLRKTEVSNVAGLAASKSLHTLNLLGSKVRDVSALQSCVSLRKVYGASGSMAGHGALMQLLIQREHENPASE
jgi:hypothetical protein